MKSLRSSVKNRFTDEVKEQAKSTLTGKMTEHNHSFQQWEIQKIRHNLLNWYDTHKRDLQWRDLAKHSDPNIRSYSGWIYAQ